MSYHSSLFPPSSVQHSRSRVVPTLWHSVFDRDFAQIERMFAPGALWEVMPAASRPFFSPPLPMTGVFDVNETLDYFKQMRDKLLSDAKVRLPSHLLVPLSLTQDSLADPARSLPRPQSFDLKDSSQGENSLTARYVTKGKNDKGSFDISHTLFLEFEPMSDKIARGVEYIDSGASSPSLSRAHSTDSALMRSLSSRSQTR